MIFIHSHGDRSSLPELRYAHHILFTPSRIEPAFQEWVSESNESGIILCDMVTVNMDVALTIAHPLLRPINAFNYWY
jgi:hypothetical protein